MPGLPIQHCSPATAHPQRHKGLSVFVAKRTEARPDPFPSSSGPPFWPLLLATHGDHPPPISQLYRSQRWTWKEGINGPNKFNKVIHRHRCREQHPAHVEEESPPCFHRKFSTEFCSDKTNDLMCSPQCNGLQSSAVIIWSFKIWIPVFRYSELILISLVINQTSMQCSYMSNISQMSNIYINF